MIEQWCTSLRWGFTDSLKYDLAWILWREEDYLPDEAFEILDKLIDRECKFYELITIKLVDILSNLDFSKPIVVLWDIDDTITKYGTKTIRPWFHHIISTIKELIPDIIFGICSTRSQEHLENVFCVENSSLFDESKIFSARNNKSDISEQLKSIWWVGEVTWHYQKVNAYLGIQKEYPDYQFILVDDIIGPQFEKQGKWISVPNNLCYSWRLNFDTWISK